MAWILTENLTDAYVQSLITRNGFTNVTDQHPEFGSPYVVEDLDGDILIYGDMNSARVGMLNSYRLIQDS